MKSVVSLHVLFAILCLPGSISQAHFPFISANDDGQIVLFFGENLAERTYKIPPAVEKAELFRVGLEGQIEKLETKPVQSDELVGMSTMTHLKPGEAAITQMRYGIYHGTRLDYYCLHFASVAESPHQKVLEQLEHALQAIPVWTEKGVEVTVTWQGAPLKDAKVSLYCDQGHSEGEEQTDGEGKVLFSHDQVEDGLNALLIGHKVQEGGEWNGQKFESCSHYLTVTFPKPK